MTPPSSSPIEAAHAAEVAALREALEKLAQERDLYKSRWLSCVTPEEAQRLKDRAEQAESALAAAHQRAAEAMREAWQPASSAPRDGSRFLGAFYLKSTNHRLVACIDWQKDAGGGYWHTTHGDGWTEGCLTHWQPLPVPPAGEKE